MSTQNKDREPVKGQLTPVDKKAGSSPQDKARTGKKEVDTNDERNDEKARPATRSTATAERKPVGERENGTKRNANTTKS